MTAFELCFCYRVRNSVALIGRRPHLLVRFPGGVLSSCSRSVRDSTRLCDGFSSTTACGVNLAHRSVTALAGSTPGENIFQLNYGAGAIRQGDCLQSSFRWVRLRAPIGTDAGLVVRLLS